jgi:hypothetical protein
VRAMAPPVPVEAVPAVRDIGPPLAMPDPVVMVTWPPDEAAAEEWPAEIVTAPPSPKLPSPTDRVIAPPAPDVPVPDAR